MCSPELEASEKSEIDCKIRLQDKQLLSGYDRAVNMYGFVHKTKRNENK